MTPREDFHKFIDGLDDDLAKPALHAVVDTLPRELVQAALERMRALRARLSVCSPELATD